MPVCIWVCALSFGRCRMSKFWLLVYLDFFESLRPTLPPSARAPGNRARLVHTNPRTVRNAPSEMACPYAAVFRLSAPLVAHSCIRLAIRSGQSHPVSWTQAQPSDWDRIATALSGSGHSTAKEEHAPSVTLPPTSPHAIVWCGDTPVLQSPDDRRERGKRKPRLGPMPASQPQRFHQSGPRDSQQARGVPGQRDGRSAASTVCHETS